MIVTICLILALLIAAVVYLYFRQLRFERAVRSFVAAIDPNAFTKGALKAVAVGILASLILRKLFGGSDNGAAQ